MGKFEFDEKKLNAAIKAVEAMCYHCEKHSDACPLAVAMGELKQQYEGKKSPKVNYKDFDFDAKKVKKAIAEIEKMCYHCDKHTDECPIAKATSILQHYVK